jgi:O-antigen ligase
MCSAAFLHRSKIAASSARRPRVRAIELLDSAIFFAMLAIIALTAIPYGTVQPWWIAAFECGVFGLGALWAIQASLEKRFGSSSILLVPLVALLVFAFVQTLPLWDATRTSSHPVRQALSADPFQTRLWMLHFGALVLSTAILLRYTSDHRRMSSLINVVIAVGVASALFGILRRMAHIELPIPTGFSEDATYGQFINRNHFALLMEMTLGLTSGLLVSGVVRNSQLPLYLATSALLWVALVLSNSRGGIVSMLGQSLFVAMTWNVAKQESRTVKVDAGRLDKVRAFMVKRVGRLSLAMCLATLMTIGVIWLGGDALMQRIEVSSRELHSETASRQNSNRLAIWRGTVALIKDHPIVGIGFGAFPIAFPAYHDASGSWIPQEAHNDYLELMAGGGIVAVGFALWFAVIFSRKAWQRLAHSADPFRRAASFGALIGLVGVGIHSVVDFGLHATVNALVCIALIVIATRKIPIAPSSQGNDKLAYKRGWASIAPSSVIR